MAATETVEKVGVRPSSYELPTVPGGANHAVVVDMPWPDVLRRRIPLLSGARIRSRCPMGTGGEAGVIEAVLHRTVDQRPAKIRIKEASGRRALGSRVAQADMPLADEPGPVASGPE